MVPHNTEDVSGELAVCGWTITNLTPVFMVHWNELEKSGIWWKRSYSSLQLFSRQIQWNDQKQCVTEHSHQKGGNCQNSRSLPWQLHREIAGHMLDRNAWSRNRHPIFVLTNLSWQKRQIQTCLFVRFCSSSVTVEQFWHSETKNTTFLFFRSTGELTFLFDLKTLQRKMLLCPSLAM